MFRPTDRQISLLSSNVHLPASARDRLRDTWAEGFWVEVYPLLLAAESEFADLYSAHQGRPNWSVARKLGVCLLQEMLNLHDQAALDLLSFDLRWHVALGLEPGEAYLSRRSLVAFRSDLAAHDPEMTKLQGVFERVAKAAIKQLKLEVKDQRLDSTHVMSNIYTRGRTDLFAKTLRHFLDRLRADHLASYADVPVALREWHIADRDVSAFGDGDAVHYRTLQSQLAHWLYDMRTAFAEHPLIVESEAYTLVVRVLDDQCTVVHVETEPASPDDEGGAPQESPQPSSEGGSLSSANTSDTAPSGEDPAPTSATPARVAITIKRAPDSVGTALQSPFDPDAGYGYKGTGYSVQIAETCNNERTEIITSFDVHGAGEHDSNKTISMLDRCGAGVGSPQRMIADTAYVNGSTIAAATERNIDLYGPTNRAALKKDAVLRDRFTFDSQGKMTHCPQGHAVLRSASRTTGQNLPPSNHAYFDGAKCRACPLLGRCIARRPNNGKTGHFHVEDEPMLRLRDERLAAQREATWWKPYAIRAGIESTNAELKKAHGLRKLRVRRLPRVRLAVTAKLTACNIKRWLRARSQD